jgi:RHS repeat-associated protein
MRYRAYQLLLVSAVSLLLSSRRLAAQVATGTPPFGSFGGGPDIINLANLNVHLAVPVFGRAGRGTSFSYTLVYDSSVWSPVVSGSTTAWQPVANFGWAGQTQVASMGYITYNTRTVKCFGGGGLNDWWFQTTTSNYYYYDSFGSWHYFNTGTLGTCNGPNSATVLATDGSGYTLQADAGINSASILESTGQTINPPLQVGTGSGTFIDRNGNEITADGAGHFTDTLGTIALSISGAAPNPQNFNYTAPSWANAFVAMSYVAYTVKTNFGCSGVSDYGPFSISLVDKVTLPDNTFYQFTYEPTPSNSGDVTGRIASVKLPTGGTITYTYTGGSSGNITCSDGSAAGLTRQIYDGTNTNTWTYTRLFGIGAQTETTITAPKLSYDPAANQTILQFQGIYETQHDTYQGSAPTVTSLPISESTLQTSNLLQEIQTSYGGSAPITQRTLTTILPGTPNSLQSKQNYFYNNYGQLTEEDDYPYGSGAPGSLLRKQVVTIGTVGNSQVVQATTVQDASGNVKAQTTITYDQWNVTATSGTPQLVAPSAARANPTTISSLVQGSTALNKTLTYFDTGNVQTATDWNGNQTSYDYSNNFYDDPGDGTAPTPHSVSSSTNAYVKKITYPTVNSVTLTTTYGYYFGTGQPALSTDANLQTSYSHFHDSLTRPTSVALPNNEWTRITYNSTDTQADLYTGTTNSTASANCSVCRHDQTVLDSLGRVKNQFLVNDPDGQTEVDTTYDPDGHVATVSNPYRSSSNGVETPAYDALGRTVQVTHADGNVAHTYYGGAVGTGGGTTSQNCSTSTYGYGYPILAVDEAGGKRQTWTDALGRVIETDEPNSSGNLLVGTCYTYDLNDNLTQVTSLASSPNQTRNYAYDMLSRATSTTTPESGTSYFYYTTSGGLLCSGNATAVCRRTDAQNVTTTYTYDALNRLISTSYNNSNPTTPTVKYGYDAVALTGCTTAPPTLAITNGLGRRTAMCDGSGATSWSFDSVGNVLTEKRTINGQTRTINYAYNLDGTIYTIQYPGNRTITYTEGNAQRMTAATDVANSINYAKAPSSGTMYAPTGALASDTHGYVSGGFAGITESYTYNNRLELTAIQATSSAGTPLNLAYSYVTGNNGNIATQTNNVSSGRTQRYTYDSLNRLLTAQAQSASGGDCWGQSFGNGGPPSTMATDALANLFYTSSIKCSSPAPQYTMNTANNNQFTGTGISYDSDGDMTADTAYSYTYDAENRIITANGMTGGPYCYTYDGNGIRVMKAHASGGSCTGTVTVDMLYWRSISGDTIAETDGTGSTTNSSYNEYVFFAGRRIAQSNPASSSAYYYFVDHLGSTRVVTTAAGTACYEADYLPYGTENTPAGFANRCPVPIRYKLTGYERDAETASGTSSGNDYAFARYYNSRLGRFMSGDALAGDTSDPQSLNHYAYVGNNPVNWSDPSGLCPRGDSYTLPSTVYAMNNGGVGLLVCSTPGVYSAIPGTTSNREYGPYFNGESSFGWVIEGYYNLTITGSGVGEGGGGVQLPKPCPPTPPAPPGESVLANVKSLMAIGLRPDSSAASVLGTFWKNVQDNGIWNYNATFGYSPENDYFGNFNFGAVGSAINIPNQALLRGAGAKKWWQSGGKADPSTPFGSYPYGNQLDKEDAIQDGINYWNVIANGCYKLVKS